MSKNGTQKRAAENLIQSGIEEHTFEPSNVREHFPEGLTLRKNRLL